MFAVIYRGYVETELQNQYIEHWKMIASYFINERGALGSTLHKAADGMWVAYSKWPDKATRDAAWPSTKDNINPELSPEVQQAILGLKQCLIAEQQFPEICMEIIEEVALK